jgi:hypothetical protein
MDVGNLTVTIHVRTPRQVVWLDETRAVARNQSQSGVLEKVGTPSRGWDVICRHGCRT